MVDSDAWSQWLCMVASAAVCDGLIHIKTEFVNNNLSLVSAYSFGITSPRISQDRIKNLLCMLWEASERLKM